MVLHILVEFRLALGEKVGIFSLSFSKVSHNVDRFFGEGCEAGKLLESFVIVITGDDIPGFVLHAVRRTTWTSPGLYRSRYS